MKSTSLETRDTVIQALLYTSAFILTFAFPAIDLGYSTFFLNVLAKTFYPLQGFWNFLLYIRPGVKKVRREHPDKNIITILREVIFHAKNRNIRERQKRHNHRDTKKVGTSHPPAIQFWMPIDNTQKTRTDPNTGTIQSIYLKHDEPIKDVISGTILGGDEKLRYEQISTQVRAMEEGYDTLIDNNSFSIPRGHKMENNGGDTTENSVHADNIASVLEADNVLHTSSLYMEDKDLEAEINNSHETQLLELNYSLGQRPLGLQWDELEGSDGSTNNCIVGDQPCPGSPISSKIQVESKDIVDDSLSLENEDDVDFRVQRRTSLVNLATISSLYDLYHIDYSDSMVDT